MKPQTFVFIGRSGCGKGTQAARLMEWLRKKDQTIVEQSDAAASLVHLPAYDKDAHHHAARKVYYLETGKRFRQFIKEDGASSKLSADIYEKGLRQPDFLAVWMWSHLLIDEFGLNDHLIADGFPRSLLEAQVFMGAMNFYKRENVHIIYMNVSSAWSRERLQARAKLESRAEDKSNANIDVRLHWFDTEVLPAIEYLEKMSKTGTSPVTFSEIDGEQPIEAVWGDIERALARVDVE
jgi:adenylate kinase family enzyme